MTLNAHEVGTPLARRIWKVTFPAALTTFMETEVTVAVAVKVYREDATNVLGASDFFLGVAMRGLMKDDAHAEIFKAGTIF